MCERSISFASSLGGQNCAHDHAGVPIPDSAVAARWDRPMDAECLSITRVGPLLSGYLLRPPSLRPLHPLPTLGFTKRQLCHVVACHFRDGEPVQRPLQNQHVCWHQHQSPNLQPTVPPRFIRCLLQLPRTALHQLKIA